MIRKQLRPIELCINHFCLSAMSVTRRYIHREAMLRSDQTTDDLLLLILAASPRTFKKYCRLLCGMGEYDGVVMIGQAWISIEFALPTLTRTHVNAHRDGSRLSPDWPRNWSKRYTKMAL